MPQQASNKESVYETTMDVPDILSLHAYDLTLASQQARKTKSHAS
jgi:alpha-L-arabinofuranosidase